jgi:hypothetical protein
VCLRARPAGQVARAQIEAENLLAGDFRERIGAAAHAAARGIPDGRAQQLVLEQRRESAAARRRDANGDARHHAGLQEIATVEAR